MIKEISAKDIKEISELFIDSFNNPPWNDEWTHETASRRLIDIINMPGYIGMAYYEENMIVGIIMGRTEQYYNGKHFQIMEFCIRSSMQGNGYGRKLLTLFIEKLKGKDITNVFLLTLHGKSTEGFYENNGFNSDEDMVMMSKKLDNI